jgi:hypothetical protein
MKGKGRNEWAAGGKVGLAAWRGRKLQSIVATFFIRPTSRAHTRPALTHAQGRAIDLAANENKVGGGRRRSARKYKSCRGVRN